MYVPADSLTKVDQLVASFVEAMPDAAVVIDSDIRVIAFNPQAKQLAPQLRTGVFLSGAIRSPDILEAAARVSNGGKSEKALWYGRVPVEQMIEVHVAPIYLDGNLKIALLLRDISEARRLERMRSDFVVNASHELRTPLSSLLGFIETLQGPARSDPEARDKFLAIMHEQGRRMARLVDDLLQLSRIEQTQHMEPDQKVDLAWVVRHVADTLSNVAADALAALKIDVPENVEVRGVRDELIQVVQNLVENAIKYGCDGEGGQYHVDISLKKDRDAALLEVRDHGPGIAAVHLPRLTERFYRVDAPTSRAKGGTGLGLAIVKHIVAHHRGQLKISSTLGKGTTFAVRIPL